MRLSLRLTLLLGVITAANLPANSILTCGTDPVALTAGACYSLSTFHYNEILDWNAAYGSAAYTQAGTVDIGAKWTVTNGTPLTAPATSSGLVVSTDFSTTSTATGVIYRYDNFNDLGMTSVRSYNGQFGLNDYLLGTSSGALTLQFNRGISGALLRISNSTTSSTDMIATIAAYSEANPSAATVPIMKYLIDAPIGDSGYCKPPAPCNTAPYIGIETGALNIKSLVISTNNPGGFYIDTLFVDEVPEPTTFALTGVVGLLAILGRRRMLCDRRP